MSRQFQDFAVPLAASHHPPSHRLVVTANRHPVSKEEFFEDLNLPEDIMAVVNIQRSTEVLSGSSFIVSCPDQAVLTQVLNYIGLLGGEYSIVPGSGLPTTGQGSVADGWGNRGTTPSLGPVPGPPDVGTVHTNTSFMSPWAGLNTLASPAPESRESPFMTEGYTTASTVPSTFRGPLTPASSAYPTIDGNTAYSDDNREFLEAAEGEKDYVDEWEQESLTGEHHTGGDGSDTEMTEDYEVEGDVEEENGNGYEADDSESGTSQSPNQSQQPSPYQGVAMSSPSNLSSVSATSLTADARIGAPNPPANQSAPSESSNASDLDSEEGEGSGGVAEAPTIDGLLNALSGLALVRPAGEHPNPSLPAGSSTTSGQHAQDSPNTSADSDTLLEMMQQRFGRTVGVEYSKVMAPASNEGMGFLGDEQE